jgi:osmoprotectant transport system substrate-binding protein
VGGATACAPAGGEETTSEPPIRVAVSADAEGTFLGHLLSATLVAAEIETELVAFADARDGRQALELGDVDVRAGYTGETWLETLGRADPPGDPEASFGPVRAQDARRGVTWLEPRFSGSPDGPPANATFAFAVAGPPGIDADLRTISQLAARLEEQPEASVCVDPEFGEREDGLRAVLDAYRVRSDRRFLATAPDEAVRAVATGGCIAGLTTATDGASWAAGLQPLEDDLEVFPAFVVAPQVRESVLGSRPEVAVALAPLAELTSPALAAWSGQVLGGASVEQVAAEAALELRDRADAAT